MNGLEAKVKQGSGKIDWGGTDISFRTARLLIVQSYLSNAWSVADRISAFVSPIVCLDSASKNLTRPPQLTPTYISDGGRKLAGALTYTFAKFGFGWPIGLSYAIRNHFVHDGGQQPSWHFFAGSEAASGFRVSNEGWDFVCKKAKEEYGVDTRDTRATEPWPWPQEDLRSVLAICEREMDFALAILVDTSIATLKMKTRLLC